VGLLGKAALMPPPPVPGAAKLKGPAVKAAKTEEDIDAEAQAKAEEVLKDLDEELREQKLPKLKNAIKAKLMKANEAAAAAAVAPPGAPMPPPPPAEESVLVKAAAAVPNIVPVGKGIHGGEMSMVQRSIMQLQDGLLNQSSAAAEEAAAIAEQLKSSISKNLAPGQHSQEVEINDYPQIVRQRVSTREPLLNIEELTGAKLMVRGQYFANPAKMPEGARKLYVEMIGPSAQSVQKAKAEVVKMCEALAIRTLNIPGMTNAVGGKPGRYDPAVGK